MAKMLRFEGDEQTPVGPCDLWIAYSGAHSLGIDEVLHAVRRTNSAFECDLKWHIDHPEQIRGEQGWHSRVVKTKFVPVAKVVFVGIDASRFQELNRMIYDQFSERHELEIEQAEELRPIKERQEEEVRELKRKHSDELAPMRESNRQQHEDLQQRQQQIMDDLLAQM